MTVIEKVIYKATDYAGKEEKLTVYEVKTTSKKVKNETFYSLKSAIQYCKENKLKYRRPQIYHA